MDSIVEHEKIKVSVITPVYNCESLISECIESVLQQTHRNLEFIIIDDGSTDNTGRICDNYQLKDDRITVIHKRNEGQGVARNVGLDICSGDYISFVDGDDSILPEMIESLLNCIILNGSDMSMCGFLVYDGLRTQKCSSYKEEIHFTNLQLMKEYVSTNKISRVPWNKLYARYLFDGIRFPSLRAHEDAYIMHSILGKVNKLVIIPDCLYKQYIRKESTENSPFSIKKLAALDCSTSIMDYYRINYPQYYSFVAFYMVDSIVDLEKQIIYSFSYRRNKELYSFLQSKLQEEYGKISPDNQKQIANNETLRAINNPSVFIIVSYINAILFDLRKKIKKIVIKVLKKDNKCNLVSRYMYSFKSK